VKKISRLEFQGIVDFFTHLRSALHSVGVPPELFDIATGIYIVGISRSLTYPLRLAFPRIKQTTGPLVAAVAQLFKPGTVVTVDPGNQKDWDDFADSPDEKLLYIPRWATTLPNGGYAYLDVKKNTLIRVLGTEKGEETTVAVTGHFACIAGEPLPLGWARPRWLSIKPSATSKAELSSSRLTPAQKATWHEIDSLLRSIGELPVTIPRWQQLVIEHICETNKRAGYVVPVFLQAWRTLAVLRSFRYDHQLDKIKPSFADLAATTLAFPTKLYGEASRFPSAQKVFDLITRPGESDGVQNPLTSKGKRYRHKPAPLKLQPIIGLNANYDDFGGLVHRRDLVQIRDAL